LKEAVEQKVLEICQSHNLKVLDALWLMYQMGHEDLLYVNGSRGEVCLIRVPKTFIKRSSYVPKFFATSSKQNPASVQVGKFLFFFSSLLFTRDFLCIFLLKQHKSLPHQTSVYSIFGGILYKQNKTQSISRN